MKMYWASLRWSKNIIKCYDVSSRFYRVNCKPVSPLGQILFNKRVLYNNNVGGVSDVSHLSPKKTTSGINQRYISVCYVMRKSKDKGEKKKKTAKAHHVDFTEAREVLDIDKFIKQMDYSIEELKENFIKHLTLRSSVGSIEQITVHFEGEEYILQELVQIVNKPKMVVLNAATFPQAIPNILKALTDSGMNLNPQQDGTTIFIPIPKVTKEYREELAKNAKAMYIRCRDTIKDIRNKEVKRLRNVSSLPEDKLRRIHAQLDLSCDDYVKRAESILDTKQKELLKSD